MPGERPAPCFEDSVMKTTMSETLRKLLTWSLSVGNPQRRHRLHMRLTFLALASLGLVGLVATPARADVDDFDNPTPEIGYVASSIPPADRLVTFRHGLGNN